MAPAPAAQPGPARGERADARRNREIVLRTASRMFTDEGLDVSLGRIAQRAGVGAGTVYRHFPSKETLLEAVFAEHVDDLAAAAGRWAARAAPGDALFGFLLDVMEKSAGGRHLCDVLAADRSWPRAVLTAAAHRYNVALNRLLRNAQQAGAVRPDVRAEDLAALIVGGSSLLTVHQDRGRGVRLVRLMLGGLRPETVTKDINFQDARSPRRHATTARDAQPCLECGAPLRVQPTGRPPSYCGSACRQRARRRRLAG